MTLFQSEAQTFLPSNLLDISKLDFPLPPFPQQSPKASALAKSPHDSPRSDGSRYQFNTEIVHIASSVFTGAAPAPLPSTESPSSNHQTQIDYQSLPSPPDIGYYTYNPGFGEEVCSAYNWNMIRHGWRVNKYGEEVANEYRRGYTPSPVRQEFRRWQEEYERLMALGTPGEEQSGDEDEVRGAASSSQTSPHLAEDTRTEERKQMDGLELNPSKVGIKPAER